MTTSTGSRRTSREILDRFDFDNQITRLAEAKLLYQVVGRFAAMHDLDKLSTHDMGYVFEHLIRKFYEDANETAGEHFTPREIIQLMVNLLIAPDEDTITGEGQVINILDPACGTGGMLDRRRGQDQVDQPERRGLPVRPGAQRGVMGNVRVGDAAAQPARHDRLRQLVQQRRLPRDRKFDYMLANPPFGVEWKKVKDGDRGRGRPSATRAGSARGCRGSTTGRSCSCST